MTIQALRSRGRLDKATPKTPPPGSGVALRNKDLMRERRHSYHTKARAYDHGASMIDATHRTLTVITASLSALVSSAIFTSLNANEVNSTWKWIAAGVSLVATILAAAVAALGYGNVAGEYRKAAISCVGLQRRAEELVVKDDVTNAEVAAYDAAAMEAEAKMPIVRDRYYRVAEAYCDRMRASDPFERLSTDR
ncbi:hypothetical protein ACWDCC_41145 [Streptomyces sp. NPDC001102]